MISLILYLILSVLPEAQGSQGVTDWNPSNGNTGIRVLIAKGLQSASFVSTDGRIFYRPGTSGPWKLTKQILLQAKDGKRYPYLEVATHTPGLIRYAAKYYPGRFQVLYGVNGFEVVNALPLDRYILGTVGNEMSPSWNLEALKAQVVASRTYALYMKKHPRNKNFDLEGTVRDQVYEPNAKESGRVAQAIKDTQGLFLVQANEPIKAHFHARCGGSTDPADAVWGKINPLGQKITCPYCSQHPFSWKAVFSWKKLMARLGISARSVHSITATKFRPSGRIASLAFGGPGQKFELDAEEVRNRLGYNIIKSTRFHSKIDHDQVEFEGVGNGHGAGMCQWGAKHMADHGKKFYEILRHFYPGITISRL